MGFFKMWNICTVEYYPTIKKNEIMLFAGKWMELEIMLSKIIQSQKAKCHVFTHMLNLDLK
jgi:RNase P/RNase MRP subunit p30